MPYVVSEDIGAGDYLLHFVWQEQDGSTYSVKYRRYDSETDAINDVVTIASSNASMPTVAVTPDGDVFIAYEDRSSNPHTISWKTASPPNYTWSSASTISPGAMADSLAYPLMVRDHVGNLHMVAAGRCDSTKWDV